jgi:hypothetical protein
VISSALCPQQVALCAAVTRSVRRAFSAENNKALSTSKIRNEKNTCGSVWVRNLVSDIKGGTQTEGVREQGAEENIWSEER